ncbi:MAG: redoxin domain-containing protein [Actinomycetota bacterium]
MKSHGWIILAGALAAGAAGHATLRQVSAAPIDAKAQDSAAAELDRGPRIRPAGDAGIGRLIPNFAARDLAGKPVSISQLKGRRGLVLAVVSSSCPVGKRLAPALGRLEAEYAAQGVPFAYVAPLASDTPDSLRAMAREAALRGPILRDAKRELTTALGVGSTTEVLVLDAARTLVYRGAVSDQYGPTWSLDAPRRSFLASALDDLLAERSPQVPATTAPGCALETGAQKPVSTPVTYHARISRILQTHCGDCHRKEGLAPFSLAAMSDVTSHAAMIERVVNAGRMPPWFAAPAEPGQSSKWANDRTMPAADKADLLAWLRGTRAAGNPDDAPLPRKFDPNWSIPKPDAVFQLPEPVAVKAEGTMPYVTREVETAFTEDKWVQAIEVAPTDRSVVHHVLVAVLPARGGRPVNHLQDELSGFFGIYVPGNSTLSYPDGFAKKIPAGSRLRFQMHYTPNGKATTDQTRIGLKFAAKPPEHEVRVAGIANILLNIPPGAADHPETARLPVPVEARIMAFLPHMHLRGKAARYDLVSPDGSRQTLLDVPRYDFNWQLYYRLKDPLLLKPGSRVEFTGRFDNSAGNPANPDPGKRVRWGAQTFDEMLLGYVEYYLETPGGEGLPSGIGAGRVQENLVALLFKRADRDNDGKVTPAELTNPELFKKLDANGDGAVTLDEARIRLPLLRRPD